MIYFNFEKQRSYNDNFFFNSSHQVAAQLLGYPTMKSAIMNWRKGLQPSVPKHIADLAECLQNDMWTAKLTYQLSFANSTTGGIETSDHTIEPYGVQIRKGATIEAHVVLGCTTFAAELMDAKLAFLDCTFNVVPNINGATQLLTVMVEHCGQVNKIVAVFDKV